MNERLVNHTRRFLAVLSGAVLLFSGVVRAGDFNDGEISHVSYPGWFSNSPFHELDEDLRRAISRGKQGLMVVYSTQGCSYCTLFVKKSLADPEIAAIIQKHFDAIGMEIFDDAELISPAGKQTTIKDFAKDEGVMFSPSILFYGRGGKQLFRLTGYPAPQRFVKVLRYVTEGHYRELSFADYVQRTKPRNTPKGQLSLRADPLFSKPPYLLQRNVIPATQPLLVIFEEPGNPECGAFHSEVLSDRKLRHALGKFEIVRLDAQDNKTVLITPDGSRMSPAALFRETQFSRTPALVFYSERGSMVLKTDELVKSNRMMNSINYVLEGAYNKGWTYQRFARTKAIERNMKKVTAKGE